MGVTRVEADAALMNRARELTGERSDSIVVNTALRRLIAAKQKGLMIDGIAELAELPRGLDEPVMPPAGR